MSEWRQRGFVQDSDEEEEESQIESQHSAQDARALGRVGRVVGDHDGQKRVKCAVAEGQEDFGTAARSLGEDSRVREGNTRNRTPTRRTSPVRPTLSPFTPIPRQTFQNERSESPDPLQSSPKSKQQPQQPAPSSPVHRSFIHQRSSQEEIELRAYALPSQILGDTAEPVQAFSRSGELENGRALDILGQFGIAALSDDSGDELNQGHASDAESKLSDYPSDLSDTEPQPAIQYAVPHRRTAVQVVIPSLTGLQHQLAQEEARRRHFRQRKPIQLHPYVLEGERYRREVQSRGLKPVPRERSPQQRQRQSNQETQEEEFNPSKDYSSSPPDPEIFVSTPIVQQPNNDGRRDSLAKRSRSDSTRRHSPALQLRVPKSAKKRRLNRSLNQALATPARTSESSPVPLDIWSLPPNSPPYSSSPPLNAQIGRFLLANNVDSLPTPSNSSTFHDEIPQLAMSDSDPVPRSGQRSGSALRQPIRTILGDEISSDSDSVSSESEQEEGELQKVSRKIRGVLPASWLRIDQQAQERRQAHARRLAQMNATQSPEPAEPQRGVAQRVVRPSGYLAGPDRPVAGPPDVMAISDDSEPEEVEVSAYMQASNVQDSIESASALAAMFDDRYADPGDDLVSMEHDRLELPTFGGSNAKRKRQPKITDAFGNAKRTKTSSGQSKSTRRSKLASGMSTHRKHAGLRRVQRTPPPALSVMDVELPPVIPQFLKLARRAACRHVNQARQSPHRKEIRLHTAKDTEDANATLLQWRQGVLRPKVNSTSNQRQIDRSPLVDATDNQKHLSRPNNVDEIAAINVDTEPGPNLRMSHQRPRERRTAAPALQVLQRNSKPIGKSPRSKRVANVARESERVLQRGPLPHRAAQLEREEESLGKIHRKIAFQKGLQRVEQQASHPAILKQPFLNPQLARFLADDDAELPPLPTREDVGEDQTENATGIGVVDTAPAPRKRLVRKSQAKRVDVDAREYRQPSEPTFDLIPPVPALTAEESIPTEPKMHMLHGLGPFGTRYPTTFDITPLKSGTYFHADTFVGSEELRRALSICRPDARDLDESAGYCTVSHDSTTIRCGPWGDETFSQLYELTTTILLPLGDEANDGAIALVLTSLSALLRELASYFGNHLSFLDPIDRTDFTQKMYTLLQTVFDRLVAARLVGSEPLSESEQAGDISRVLSYLLVINVQVQQISGYLQSNNPDKTRLLDLIKSISQQIMNVVAKSTSSLYEFHEKNKLYKVRESGIQDHDVLIETIVVSMHALELVNAPSLSFWDLIGQELSSHLTAATHLHIFESTWATIFSLLPIAEFDVSGIPDRNRTQFFNRDNWSCLCDVLKRVLGSYLGTSQQQGSSINDYIRVSLTRCYILINDWHWKRPDQVLNVVFDFYGKYGLRPLRRETATGSAQFLQDFAIVGSLALAPNDSSFHIALKCLATGLQGMTNSYPEKRIRSFVFRRIPNHGRTHPKDQPLEEASLAALRNHHDLLSTLYCAAPPSCRPKLERIRDLVSHETSHREACRVSVRAWSNLTTFQLSTEESYDSARLFAYWHKDIMHQTLKQYQLANIEAEDYLKSGVLDGTSEVAKTMVRQTMTKNQEQSITTLRDGIAGMKKAVESAIDQTCFATFFADSDFIQLLELPHLDDHRLVNLIRDALAVLRQYASLQRACPQQQVSQQRSEESQDYGDFPDLDDLDEAPALQPVQATVVPQSSRFDFIQGPLWHLMSNAFGAERLRDDNLLMDCIDTWVAIVCDQVIVGGKQWSHYVDPFSQVSWQQLPRTEHTNKFGPYFMAAVITYDSAAYEEHRHEFLTALLLCLADRESMLRFQHRLLDAIVQTDEHHPLLRSLPFFRVESTGRFDITSETLRSRRLALISSLLSNMRDDVHATTVQEPSRAPEVKRTYAAMLKDFMNRLKSNYQHLQQGDAVTGAYVEFVQKIVQFLKQYTGDICPVLPFFTDSVAFPLPSTDPTYVVGRLCGYAPKANDPGIAKQLSVFIQTVAQQAAADNHQVYLVNQLKRALCTDEAPLADRAVLRTVLLQAIFPAYIEVAFSSPAGHLVARPILQCLPAVLGDIIYDLRVSRPESLSTAIQSIVSVAHAFIRSTEHLKGDVLLFRLSNTSNGLAHMFEVSTTILRLLDYAIGRTISAGRPPLVTYFEKFSIYVTQMISGTVPEEVPSYGRDADPALPNVQRANILAFCQRSLRSDLETNWSADHDSIWFGQGRTKKQVNYDVRSVERERTRLLAALQVFQDTKHELAETVHRDDYRGFDADFINQHGVPD